MKVALAVTPTLVVLAVAVFLFWWLRSTLGVAPPFAVPLALLGACFLVLGFCIIWATPAQDDLTTRYSYDDEGRLVSVTDPYGRISTYRYDGQRVLTATSPVGVEPPVVLVLPDTPVR
jgi:YD repeat-containing protein